MNGAIARIAIRYGVGIVLGSEAANIAAGDPDLVAVIAAAVGVLTEVAYAYAVKKGWAK